jgi:hypothetical protein
MTTHWKGPLLSSHTAGGGLYENFPIQMMSALDAHVSFVTDFSDHALATYWTQTNIVAGTATIAQDGANPSLSLTHGTAAQGPSVRWLGSAGAGNALVNVTTNGNTSLFEARFTIQANVDRDDYFLGFMTSVAAHPLLAGPPGDINLAGVADGAGFHWLDANNGRPILVAWRAGALETLTSPPTLAADANAVARYFGVRLERDGTGTSLRYYINRRLVHTHRMSADFSARMTWGVGQVARGAGAQGIVSRLALGRLNTAATPPE